MNEKLITPEVRENIRINGLVASLTDAVMREDFDFMLALSDGQSVFHPTEVALFLFDQGIVSRDASEAERWHTGLECYLQTIDVSSFTADELKTIEVLKRSCDTNY